MTGWLAGRFIAQVDGLAEHVKVMQSNEAVLAVQLQSLAEQVRQIAAEHHNERNPPR